jgi:hypothetical protein
MTLVIALNIIFAALVLTVIVGGHAWAILTERRAYSAAAPAPAPERHRQAAAQPRARRAYATS